MLCGAPSVMEGRLNSSTNTNLPASQVMNQYRKKRASRIAMAFATFPGPVMGTLLVAVATLLSPLFVMANVVMALFNDDTHMESL